MKNTLNPNRKEATLFTRTFNQKLRENFNPKAIAEEDKDIEAFQSHFILRQEDNISDKNGNVIWNIQTQHYIQEDYPDSVNSYLWRNAKEGMISGVAELVTGKVYITTGISVAPIGYIKSANGWIIQDTGSSVEDAEVSLNLLEKAIGETVRGHIKAIIISHTHHDHFGGTEAFLNYEDDPEKIPIYAPVGYEKSMTNDNLSTGIAMARRVQYQAGIFLPRDDKGYVSMGLSNTPYIPGRISSVFPNELIEQNKTLALDGIEVDFILTPDTETEAHMVTYFRNYHTLYLADDAVGTIHNTYTMRGAQVRDANYWGQILYKLYLDYGEDAEVIFAGHGIPLWKTPERPDKLKRFLLDNAAAYKFTSDQALLLANKGYTLNEIGNAIEIPESISRTWYTRAHYGNYTFNARGAYQRYLGFYDGNPVHLLPLPEKELAEKFIEYAGSFEKVLEHAKQDYENGEYQWVATVTNHLVFSNPQNLEARYLCADALEQLGYQAESALWRNAYLSAAIELRNPEINKKRNFDAMANKDYIAYVSSGLLLNHLGINFDGYRAEIAAVSDADAAPPEYLSGNFFRLQSIAA
ncbi:alkyl sulfatase dimerization domain-containing protein [Agathobacter sp.]|uniref:alkyl sulfatase dimerization domain-containing protein n=1 Tax=Agathobacter sp. TaxID=2021311 RepID=UPI003FD85D66